MSSKLDKLLVVSVHVSAELEEVHISEQKETINTNNNWSQDVKLWLIFKFKCNLYKTKM